MPSRVRLPGTYQTVTVTVPPGKLAGSRLVVQAGGRLLTAVVPRGLAAGDSFTIDVPIERTRKEKLRAMPSQIAAVARLLAEKIADNAPRILRKVPGAPRVEAAIDKFKAERAAAEELRTRRARRGRPGSAADMLRQRRRRGTAPARTNMRTEWAMSAPRGQSGPNDISDTRPAGRAELRGPRPPDPRFSIGSLGDEGSPVPDAPADPDWDSFTSSRQQVRRLSQPAVDGLPVVTNSDGGHDLFMSSRGPSTSQQAEPEPETEVGQLFDLDVADPSWETVNEALATMPAKLPAPGSQMVPAADGVWLDHATANSKAATAANETGGGWLAERSQHAGSSGGASEADNQGRAAGLAHWTVTEVGEWLATCAKMPRHVDEFARREIDGFMLSRIDQIDLADMEIGKSTLECNDLLSLRDQFLTSANGQMGGIGVRASADAYGAKNVFDGEDEAI